MRLLALLAAMPDIAPNVIDGFVIDAADRDRLLGWVRRGATTPRLAVRGAVVLLAGAGWNNTRIAAELGVSRRTVAFWKARYRTRGAASLLVDAPGRGRKPGRDHQMVSKILTATQEMPPPASRWTVRSLARAVGVSHATVQRVWREHGITHAAARPPG